MKQESFVYVTVTTVCIIIISVKADSVLLVVMADSLEGVDSLQLKTFMLNASHNLARSHYFIQQKFG